MDVVWIIIDSLSFSATPFADDGPDTMPKMEALAAEEGLVFTEAYVPGPKSPSSHGSFLTGQLPSKTGMHEAYPSFESDLLTISDAVKENYRSYLVSSNPFLFNGLDERFDETTYLNDQERTLFNSAADPKEFKWERGYDSKVERYKDFVLKEGKPIRSLLNGIYYKYQNSTGDDSLIPSRVELDPLAYQSVETMNQHVRSFVDGTDDAFVVANYMDVHPPLNASEEALQRWTSKDVDDLPIGVSGHQLQEHVEAHGREQVDTLYHASIWDLDRKLTPVVRQFVEAGAHVIVTADHGNWFQPEEGLTDEKLHVPLILFSPELGSDKIDDTVNLIQLPATTIESTDSTSVPQFYSPPLQNVTKSQISITEYFRAEGGGPVNPFGGDETICYDVAGIKNQTRVDYSRGEFDRRTDISDDEDEIIHLIESVRANVSDEINGSLDYDEATEQRLKELGYL